MNKELDMTHSTVEPVDIGDELEIICGNAMIRKLQKVGVYTIDVLALLDAEYIIELLQVRKEDHRYIRSYINEARNLAGDYALQD